MVEDSEKVCIIAEAGVNHNGSPARALAMVDAAKDAGADVVKFQTFRAELVARADAPKAAYQEAATGGGSQLDMLRRYELSAADHERIAARCREVGIEFLSTPGDRESVALLVGLGVSRIKIPSGEITNWPLIHRIASTGKPVLMSTGMATIPEIRGALSVFLMGALRPGATPDGRDFARVYESAEGRNCLKERVTLLHCTTQYPTLPADVNLRAVDTLREEFGLPAGYSDHTEGIAVAVAAAARGAAVIEKHFTLDRNLEGPDHRASIEPGELAALVESVRSVERALGSGRKGPAPGETENIAIVRKSLTALRGIESGEVFTEDNLGVKRPGDGIPATEYWKYLGRAAGRPYRADERIDP